MAVGCKMRRENRVVFVDKGRVPVLLDQGYDQISADGKIIKRATGGRSVSLSTYNKLIDENEVLKARLEELKKASVTEEPEKPEKPEEPEKPNRTKK